MKFLITKALIVFVFISVAFAGAYLEYFHAYGENENIKLEWKTGQEDNIKSFVIVRKTPQTQYRDIVTIPAKGSYSFYTYIDESAYKTNDLIFKYGLKVIDNNNISNKHKKKELIKKSGKARLI